ncbi:MAG: DUF2846 domain-containing protein [Hyphomonadaceae bacterium]|nr:DUF2846 domain-containing protein [Hyphomonadaceae bacterium]
MKTLHAACAALLFAAMTATAAIAQDTTAPAAQAEQTPPSDPAAAPQDPAAAPADPNAATSEASADASAPATDVAAAAPAEEPPGRIIFFRPGRLTGGAYTYHVVTVGEDGDSTPESPRVGSLPNGRFFVYEAPPGIYNFNIRGPMAVNLNEDRIRLEVESGQTYYIEQTVRVGLLTGGFRLVPSTQEEYERRRLREWTPRVENEDSSN